ncbi:MAG TPA: transcription elongation protein SprT [Cytophagales bacterium]|jgi:SprT protein|nr:transcription elongation protein SprT [Cytophagales bacterium]
MDQHSIRRILIQHVPANSLDYCCSLWRQSPFDFKLRKSRQTKVGDFTFRVGRTPTITVNHDLHPYLFLMTFIHEVAHHYVHQHCKGAEAHGKVWKKTFQDLMQPILTEEIFPETLLTGLKKHMLSPKASSFSDSELTSLFRSFDQKASTSILLSHLPEGSIFHLQGKWFKKGKLRRTRVLCDELKTKRKYLVPIDAPVTNAQLSLL